MSPPCDRLGHVDNSAAKVAKVASPLRILDLSSSIWDSWPVGSKMWETLTCREGSSEELLAGGDEDMLAEQMKIWLR